MTFVDYSNNDITIYVSTQPNLVSHKYRTSYIPVPECWYVLLATALYVLNIVQGVVLGNYEPGATRALHPLLVQLPPLDLEGLLERRLCGPGPRCSPHPVGHPI